jgi:sensor histidine kinase YesM
MKGRIAIRILIMGTLYAVLYYTYTLFSLQGSLFGIFTHWISFLYILGWVFFAGLTIQVLLNRLRLSFRGTNNRSLPFLVGTSLILTIILAITLLSGLIYRYIFYPEFSSGELNEVHPGLLLQVLVISLLTGIVYAVADHSMDSFRHLQDIRLATRQAQTQQVNLRFESLRSQISPHFLFNSLNTISSLIYRDVSMAGKFVRNLASVYQSVLRNYRHPLVSLRDELKLVEHYSYLMQVRFEDAFHLELDPGIDPDSFSVPPLSVQMLLENAIKHNHMSLENPLRVSIRMNNDYLVVSNNFIGNPGHIKIGNDLYKKPGDSGSTGIGLENIRNRFRILSKKPVLISKDDHFTVSLPLIPSNEAELVHQ